MASKRGVTLIELLVAMGILALLVAILYSVFSVSLRAWKKADNIFKSTTIARIVLDRISREISSAIIKDDNTYCLLGFDSSSPSGWRTNSVRDEIYFIAPLKPDNPDLASDLCEAGYWLDGRGTADSSDDVLKRFYVKDTRYNAGSNFDFNFSTGASNQFSENITDFKITFFDKNGIAKDSWSSADSSGSITRNDGVPSKIEVSITVQVGMGTQSTNPEYYKKSYTTTISLLR